MKIGIEAQAANKVVRTGAGEYAFRLLEAMMPQASSSEEVSLYTAEPLQASWSELPASWQNRVLSWSLPGWSTFRLNLELLRYKPDVAFFPSSVVPLLAPSRKTKKRASVVTVHDIGFDRVPQVYAPSDRRRQRRAMKRVIKKCDHLLTVSEFTKQELLDRYHVEADRITVTPLGIDQDQFKPASPEKVQHVREKYHLSQHYFLFVSRVDAKKNVENLIRAFTIFKEARGFGDPHELVIAGPEGFGFGRIKQLVEVSSVKDSIHIVGAVSNEEKVALYTGALGYVNLSWYEGFGLTPLEAAACGTPSLLSDIPAHREVMGEGAIYVSPKAPEYIASEWKRFAEEGATRERILSLAQPRLGQFTWEEAAKETWEVLRGVLAPEGLFQPSAYEAD